MNAPKYRSMRYGITSVQVQTRDDGVQYVLADVPLGDYPHRMTDKLLHWARVTPERTYVARRKRLSDGSTGDWEHLTYAQALTAARRIGQALLDRGLSVDKPVLILSENSLEHAMMALACMMVGVAHCPVSPAYSTISKDYDKLKHIIRTLTPGMVMAVDADRYGAAMKACVPDDVEIVLGNGQIDGRTHTRFASLLETEDTSAVDAAMQATGPDTVVKFLFTSGSTNMPKGVVNTHGMWCANQQQMLQSMPVLAEAPPVLVDWLPWNHTFGGNHNIGLVLYHGGSIYIDDGKPVPALMHETLRNLREVAPTVYFNVPTGLEAIANAMHTDDVLRRNLLSKVRMFFYSGAPYVQDAVITGLNMKEVGAMMFTTPRVRELCDLPASATLSDVLHHPKVMAYFQQLLNTLATQATGSANRVARMVLLSEPASIDKGEVTDKGSINQRAVLKHRDALVQALHDGTVPGVLLPH